MRFIVVLLVALQLVTNAYGAILAAGQLQLCTRSGDPLDVENQLSCARKMVVTLSLASGQVKALASVMSSH